MGKINEDLVGTIKKDILDKKYKEGEEKIVNQMLSNPHSPVPHNLMGILEKMQDNQVLAMKHFRAAYALDPTYLPSRHNLELCGSFFLTGEYYFSENDCVKQIDNTFI